MKLDYLSELISRYKAKGVLVDSNLLLLYFVGLYDPERINTFKRTCGFTTDDFDLLVKIISYFKRVVTTPSILTEVNGLSNQLRKDEKRTYYSSFGEAAQSLEEQYTPSADICGLDHFKNFGLTDSGIINLAKGKYLVLTVDFSLSAYLRNVGIDVINFNHIRVWAWST